METYGVRVERQTANASKVAEFLTAHPKVATVRYLGSMAKDDPAAELAKRQWTSGGAMISFEVVGGRDEAFRFLDSMQLITHTTSLGGTESIASHPWTTSHANVDEGTKRRLGITESMIRLSVGIEAPEDLVGDLEQALARV
jgi:methionine-gamma-lyase